MTQRQAEIIDLLHKEVKPALGCTEPIAVALAVAKACELIQVKCVERACAKCISWRLNGDFDIDVKVSGNILKNGMGVGIPGTGMVGLYIASALGAVCGRSEYGLEVLSDLEPDMVERAKAMVEAGRVKVSLADTTHKLYVKATIITECHKASAVVADDHDNIVELCLDENLSTPEFDAKGDCGNVDDKSRPVLTVNEIYEFATTVAYEDIAFILESRTLNYSLAEEGLHGNYGLMVGKTISGNREVFGMDFMSYAMSLTASACDARMAGCTLPAMSNSGSGNQGITVTMPVIAYSMKYDVDNESLARALVISHLVAIHIKSYLGKLSALCGCVVASTGAACGLVYLRGGSYGQICSVIKNMIGNITGMVCDGAKVGCAMKVASGVASAIQSAVLAMDGICISENDGIIEKDIEKTIKNLGQIGSVGMQTADNMILDIMACK